MYSFDNLRFFLIFLVIVGHMLELDYVGNSGWQTMISAAYFWIYSFHMPAFIFLSGFFSRFNVQKILKFGVLYIIFQILYILFSAYVLKESREVQFITPYWILWYIVTLIYYYSMIPVLSYLNGHRTWVVLASVLISLGAGCFRMIGYPLSLSRFLVFLPFFVVGFYSGQNKEEFGTRIAARKWYLIAAGICGSIVTAWLFLTETVTARFFYGSYSYEGLHEIPLRLLHLFIAFAAIGLLLFGFMKKAECRVPYITAAGHETLAPYLLHGFFVKYLDQFAEPFPIFYILICALALIFITGNRFVRKMFHLWLKFDFPGFQK